MELSDPGTIAALLEATQPVKRPRARLYDAAGNTSPRSVKVRRCLCGTCFHCRENARWEKVFNEKFADPDYYKDRGVRFGSSLS